PPALSAQFQVMVTGVLFHPLPFAAGACVGLAVGDIVSAPTFTEYMAFPTLPARSAQVAVSVTAASSPAVLVVVQLAVSIPLPCAPSVQFQTMTTSLLVASVIGV